jgi:hypothetical protein
MQTKISVLRGLIDAGRLDEAVKFAGKFPRLGDEKVVITRAREALIRPEFFRALGRDVDAIVAAGRVAVVRKYSISDR